MARLVLGTAQLGMPYGVANTAGVPPADDAVRLLRRAEAGGVAAVDTAPGYGNAEELVGRSGIALEVFTKLDPSLPPDDSIGRSLRRLKRRSVGVVFLHQPDLVQADPTDVIGRATRQSGLFKSLGASVYTTTQFRAALDDPRISTIQAPVSVADQRLVRAGLLAVAAKAGKRVVARSVYLQGALTLAPDALPARLTALADRNRALAALAAETGRGVPELLLGFVRDVHGITDVLLGCETAEQLTQALRAFDAPPLDDGLRVALEQLAVDDDDLVDPRRWAG